MNWMLKCAAFYGLRFLPHRVYHWAQEHITGRHTDTLTDQWLNAYGTHVEALRSLPSGAVALEFGAGRNLLTPLLLSAAGASKVIAIDVVPMATVQRVNGMIAQLARHRPMAGYWRPVTNLGSDLREKYRIDYRAPADMRATGLPPCSVDLICSTSTLEHIPPAQIRAIIQECRRLCRPRGMLSMIIDYHDHYASADPRIDRFHFYRYPEWLWSIFSPREHFQNRLRHSDYELIFQGFEFATNRRIIPEGAHLNGVHLHTRFKHYAPHDLLALNGVFLLRMPLVAESEHNHFQGRGIDLGARGGATATDREAGTT